MPSRDRGQATVELVALLPALAVLALGVWQVAVAGHTVWAAGAAARAASRALAVGGDPVPVARRLVPRRLAAEVRVREGSDGTVRVSVPVRSVVGGHTITRVAAVARFEPQG
jgi:hypothetical protein